MRMSFPLYILFGIAIILCQQTASAYDFVVDGIAYSILSSPPDSEPKAIGCVGVASIVPIDPSPIEGTHGFPNYPDLPEAVIPEVVEHEGNNYQVTQILDDAFSFSQSITHVQIPGSVTRIGARAFSSCISLKEIVIPQNVTQLGARCFEFCNGLESICILGALEIPLGAFDCCHQLHTIEMPNVYGILGQDAFARCSSLRAIEIPDGVTAIRQGAFSDCHSLESIHIGKSVTQIDHNYWPYRLPAFDNTPNLKKITVAPENTSFDSRDNCNAIIYTADNAMLYTCSNSSIPGSVKILNGVFNDLKGQEHIEIPEGIEVVSMSFCGCDMKSVSISCSVREIYRSFLRCDSLMNISVSPQNPTFDSRDNCNAIINTAANSLIRGCNTTIIPSTVKRLGEYAFTNIKGIKTLRIPSGVVTIYKGAFYGCDGLKVLYYDAKRCYTLCSTIYDTVINPDSWYYEELGESPFPHDLHSVIQLDSVIFGPEVVTIPDYLLWGQKHIKQIRLPSTIQVIGENAFGNSGLQQITLPENISMVGRSSFSVTPLQQVYCMAVDPNVAQVAQDGAMTYTPFDLISDDCVLYVPSGRKQSFESHPAWRSFKTVIEMVDKPSDVNGDYSVDIADVNVIVNVMINNLSPTSRADVNGDGVVDIADVNQVINTMLGVSGL